MHRWHWHTHSHATAVHGYCCHWRFLHWNKSCSRWRHHYDQYVVISSYITCNMNASCSGLCSGTKERVPPPDVRSLARVGRRQGVLWLLPSCGCDLVEPSGNLASWWRVCLPLPSHSFFFLPSCTNPDMSLVLLGKGRDGHSSEREGSQLIQDVLGLQGRVHAQRWWGETTSTHTSIIIYRIIMF